MPMNMFPDSFNDPRVQEVFDRTEILRKPISGIVSGYHELPYVMIAPKGEDSGESVKISGRISVSPKFVISPQALGEAFGDVFDPETFESDLQGRMFSFGGHRKQLKVASEYFQKTECSEPAGDLANRTLDELLQQEDIRTGLILAPKIEYYPVSIDRFITEITDREFRV